MTLNNENQDLFNLKKKIEMLEEENALLRAGANTTKLTVTEGEYKGYPTLTFDGNFRKFTLGLKKLSIINQAWTEVQAFLHRHTQKSPTSSDDDKI